MGVRVSELEGICVQDILWNESKVHIKMTKAYRERLVPLQSKMKIQLQYIQIRGVIGTDASHLIASQCQKGNSKTELHFTENKQI